MAGITDTGLTIKSLADIKADFEGDYKAAYGNSIAQADGTIAPQTAFGQMIGIQSDRIAELWQLGQSIYSAFDPDKATGQAQDALCALTGTIRKAQTYSTMTVSCTGTNGTVLPVGRKVQVDGALTLFDTIAVATLATATAWVQSTAYVVGDIRKTAATRVYVCITAGTSSGSGVGPASTSSNITDGTAHWAYVGEGAAYATVAAMAEDPGPLAGVAGVLTIKTPVSGWSTARNLTDATPGVAQEVASALRTRREQELQSSTGGPLAAIRGAVLKVANVKSVKVYENFTLVTDGNGVPAKSVEVLVDGGDDDDVREAVFLAVGGGIQTYGSGGYSGTVVDSQGDSHTVDYSRPTLYTIYISAGVTIDPTVFAATGVADIKAAIVAAGALYESGRDVTASAISAMIFKIPGVLEVPSLPLLKTSATPTVSTTISVDVRHRATFDTSWIGITTSNGTP